MSKISTKGFAEMSVSGWNGCLNCTILDDSGFSGGFFDGRLLRFLDLLGLGHFARGSILQEDDDHDLQSS